MQQLEAVMNIAGIDNFRLTGFIPQDVEGSQGTSGAPLETNDIVNLNTLPDMSDEEVEALMTETEQMIGNDYLSALTVHSGLDENRVYRLLGMA